MRRRPNLLRIEVTLPTRRFALATYSSKLTARPKGWGRASPFARRKMAMKLAITLRLGLAGLLIAILCLCMFVFSDIAYGSPLVVAFSAIAGASTTILMVLYFASRKD